MSTFPFSIRVSSLFHMLTPPSIKLYRIFGSKEKSLTQEELKARKDEESLFSELPKLPTILSSVAEVLDCNQNHESQT